MVGIISYGAYVPKYRLKTEDVANAWKKQPGDILGSLGIKEKAVPAGDEDAVTLAVEATMSALQTFKGEASDIETLLVGSESHPYAVNPTSTIVGELVGVGNNYLAADLEFACKAGTAGVELISGLIASGKIKFGLAIGSDTAQSKPHDALEYSSGAAAVGLILGSRDLVANLSAFSSYSSDTPDFWRRDGIRYPSHAGRFTGEPAYFAHVMGASKRLFSQTGLNPADFTHAVFHMPNGKFPREAAKRLGFTTEQIAPSLIVDDLGNPYSASSLLGLTAVLDIAKPKEKIFMVSYGSGAGSDAFVWETTEKLPEIQAKKRQLQSLIAQQMANKVYIDYVQYLKQTHKI